MNGNPLDSRTISLSWDPPEAHETNGIIREYRVEIVELESGNIYHHVTPTTSITVSSLHPDYTYEWSVAAFTVAEGPYSDAENLTTPEDGEKCIPAQHETDV